MANSLKKYKACKRWEEKKPITQVTKLLKQLHDSKAVK